MIGGIYFKRNIIISKNINDVPVCVVKVFLKIKYVEKAKKKVRRTIFQNIKDLTNQYLNITKFGSTDYEGFCEKNVLENQTQSLQRLVKEFNV